MTRIIGHMVTRNELGRYLSQTLPALQEQVESVVVYDDQSDDGTLEFLRAQGVLCARRDNAVLPFEEDESRFRQAAWRFMEDAAKPGDGDWILCLDADEFLVTDDPADNVRSGLEEAIAHASSAGRLAANLNVREVFGFERSIPLIRTDAYWGGITACRLVRWRESGTFDPCPEAGGSVPTAWIDWRYLATNLSILHLGYARAEDRKIKHDRYAGGRHNPSHVASILHRGRHVPWTGQQPPPVSGPS